MPSDYKTGKCKWCGDVEELWSNSMLCDSCDSDTIYCHICRNRQHYESKCRHVFQGADLEWLGAGVDPCDRAAQGSFHRLLSAMGEEFAVDLKKAIGSGGFYTWMVAPMIGGGGLLTMNGMPQRDGKWMVNEWGDRLIGLGESDRAEKISDGYHWLVSLYKRSTLKANRTTVAWIDQWLWPLSRLDQGAR